MLEVNVTETLINVSDLVEGNGLTIKQNNMARKHKIPLGSLVFVRHAEWHGDGSYEKLEGRYWVVEHERDCDGTPLYAVCRFRRPNLNLFQNESIAKLVYRYKSGFSEESLTVVEATQDVLLGNDVDLEITDA
jgi:hypothetical protein